MKERHAAASVEAPELKKRDIEKLYYRNVALPLYRNRKSSGQNPCMVQGGFWTNVAGNIPFAIAGYVVGK
ncbi:MAG TPA: hypothetical protein PK253_19725 [Spirochaetota bacterium]|nr:hypothetical protein [Spirochaetota bacterium]